MNNDPKHLFIRLIFIPGSSELRLFGVFFANFNSDFIVAKPEVEPFKKNKPNPDKILLL